MFEFLPSLFLVTSSTAPLGTDLPEKMGKGIHVTESAEWETKLNPRRAALFLIRAGVRHLGVATNSNFYCPPKSGQVSWSFRVFLSKLMRKIGPLPKAAGPQLCSQDSIEATLMIYSSAQLRRFRLSPFTESTRLCRILQQRVQRLTRCHVTSF